MTIKRKKNQNLYLHFLFIFFFKYGTHRTRVINKSDFGVSSSRVVLFSSQVRMDMGGAIPISKQKERPF